MKKILKNIFDTLAYIMAIILAIDVMMIMSGYGHLDQLVLYILEYFC